MKNIGLLLDAVCVIFFTDTFCTGSYTLKSPDTISTMFLLTSSGEPVYSISHSGLTILKQSKLGIIRSDEDFSTNLTLDSASGVSIVNDSYKLLHGKRLNCNYTGNKQIFYLKNANSKTMEIIFQVSNDGCSIQISFPRKTDSLVRIFKEVTSYHFDVNTKAFLQPCPDARMGWCFSSPSYEEYYNMNISVGTSAPNQAGWVMPALFNSGKYWISITETAVDTNYCETRLSQLLRWRIFCEFSAAAGMQVK